VSQPVDDKPSLKGTWSGSRDQVADFTPPSERLKLQTSNFVHGLVTRSTNFQATNCPLSERGLGHVIHFRILHPLKFLQNG